MSALFTVLFALVIIALLQWPYRPPGRRRNRHLKIEGRRRGK